MQRVKQKTLKTNIKVRENNMKNLICKAIKAITFGKVCLGWCSIACKK
jgi:hypothetical protein